MSRFERKNKSVVISSCTSSVYNTKPTSSSREVDASHSEKNSGSLNSSCNEFRATFNSEPSKETISIGIDTKIKKKVIVKPTEARAIKLPMKPTTKGYNSSQEVQIFVKGDNKSIMADSSHLNCSGIPRPTAAVKGTSKPTNSVAPMLIVKPESEVSVSILKPDNEKKSTSRVEPLIEESENIIDPGKSDINNHSKQSSLGDEEDTLVNIKPMEPLLRGYKRSIALPRRISPSSNMCIGNQQRYMNGQSVDQYNCLPRFDTKKVHDNDDFEITSGYVSDGDVLHANNSVMDKLYPEVGGGYISEGSVQFYQRYSNNLDLKFNKTSRKNDILSRTSNLSSSSESQNSKQIFNGRGQSTDVLTALSTGSPLHKFGSKLNGRGLGLYEGPISPPEPTPTHGGTFTGAYRVISPHLSPPEPSPVVYRVVGARSQIKKSDSCQQTDNSSFSRQTLSNNGQWRKYSESETVSSGGLRSCTSVNNQHLRSRNEPCSENVRIREKRSPSTGAANTTNTGSLLRNRSDGKKRTSSVSSSREELEAVEFYHEERKSRSDTKNKVKGVPSSFGYVKRSTSNNSKESRTAQVSAVPRTKVKVSGGTQTDMKSYSLSSTAASQLSQSVRERILMGSDVMPKSPSRSQSGHHKAGDRDSLPGSLFDSTYSDLQMLSNHTGSWFRQSSPYTASLPTRSSAVTGLLDAESIESLPAQLQHRASLTNTRLLTGSASSPSNVPTSRLSRSNSISYLRERTFPRSTKSEKLYPLMLQRSDEMEPLYTIPYGLSSGPNHMTDSQDEPPSPTPSHLSTGTSAGSSLKYHYSASPSSSSHGYSRNSPYMSFLTKMNSKEDDMHGSAMSLVSTASSSLYGAQQEDKQTQEMRRLRRDLNEAQQKVHCLTSQISTNFTLFEHILCRV